MFDPTHTLEAIDAAEASFAADCESTVVSPARQQQVAAQLVSLRCFVELAAIEVGD